LGDPGSQLSFVEFINIIQIEFNQFFLIVLNMKWRLNLWIMPLNRLFKCTLQAENPILDALDNLLAIHIK
jgi:hypothetical protein